MVSLYKFFTGKGQMVGFLLGVGLVLLTIATVVGGIRNAGYDIGEDFNAMLKAEGNKETFDFFQMVPLIPAILVIAIFVIIVLFGIKQIVDNPKGSMKILAGLGVLLILAFVFYSISDPETAGKIGILHEKFNVSDTASKWISGGLKSVLSLLGLGLGLIVVSEIRNLFK